MRMPTGPLRYALAVTSRTNAALICAGEDFAEEVRPTYSCATRKNSRKAAFRYVDHARSQLQVVRAKQWLPTSELDGGAVVALAGNKLDITGDLGLSSRFKSLSDILAVASGRGAGTATIPH